MKVNLGCGHSYIDGWVNVDASPNVRADIHLDAFEFVRQHGPETDELYMGHFLEHLLPASAVALLAIMADRLPEGAQVSAVVPDMRAIFAAYDAGEVTNDELNERFVYSYEQPSRHVWCYDVESLAEVFRTAGFVVVEEIDPLTWEPVFWKAGPESRWQCGVRAIVPAGASPRTDRYREPVEVVEAVGAVATVEEVLLARVEALRAQVAALRAPNADSAPPPVARAEPAAPAPPSPAVTADGPSMFDRLPAPLAPVARKVLTEGSSQRAVARFGVDAARATRVYARQIRDQWSHVDLGDGTSPRYPKWRRQHLAGRGTLAAQRSVAERRANPLHVCCVVFLDGAGAHVQRTIRSLQDQSWPHWRVVLVGPGAVAAARSADDQRVTGRESGGVGSDALGGVVAEQPDRDFVIVLRAGDELAHDCCFEVAITGERDPLVDLVYWDDDVRDQTGGGRDPRFRPSWSPEFLLSHDYVGSAFAMRARRVTTSWGIRDAQPDALWDLLLRADLDASRVARVPRVLSHLRERADVSPATALAVVAQELDRRRNGATARWERGAVRVVWPADLTPTVSVVIPTRHNREVVGRCLRSLGRTDYPSLEIVVIDNGDRTAENEQWYEDNFADLDLRVEWWDAPFNYSSVNNRGAALAHGEVLVFLNDDTEASDPQWLRELAGWAVQPGIGLAGAQLIGPAGEIQHGGVILGMNGFADHLFQGMGPDSQSLLGPTTSYRNLLSVTAACVAVRRPVFEELGGFDERFELCGSDVVLGLDAVLSGYRNVCTPFAGIRHLESATRGTDVPLADFFASYWRYQRWVSAGDPYFSPSLSTTSREPALRSSHERPAAARMAETLGRPYRVFRMQSDGDEAAALADLFRVTDADARAVSLLHETNRAPAAPESINWFLPELDSPFYGGVNTVLRLADHLRRTHGVQNRFVFWAAPNEPFFRSALAAAFPGLGGSEIAFHDASRAQLELVPPADAAVASLWATAYSVAQFPHARRKFYMIQDFEPVFYPAGTRYALAEESYRLGLYGICNTEHMLRLYESRYGGIGTSLQPAVDGGVFHAEGRRDERTIADTATVFVYARPGHWRNCWEMASIALEELKERLGDRVRIVTAGSWARPEDLGSGIEHLGLLDYRETGNLYRRCDVGVALTVSEHPSYLPLELMACGVPVVAFDNPAGYWALRHGENSFLCRRTVDALRDAIERIVLDPELGRTLGRGGVRTIAEGHSSWDKAFAAVYGYLSNPEGG